MEMFPFVSGDTLYFSSNGHFGLGGLDIFQVDLSGEENPVNLGYPINTSADDFGLISERSGQIGFFSSNRVDNKQEANIDQIYSFSRKVIKFNLIVNVYERYDFPEILPNQSVTLKNTETGEEKQYLTDDNGQIFTSLGADQTFIISTQKDDFKLENKETVTTVGLNKNQGISTDLFLLPTRITIGLKVIGEDTKLPLESASVNISDYLTGGDFDTTLVTNKQGIATITVDRYKDLLAHASKTGYIDKENSFNTEDANGRIIQLELSLSLITTGTTFKLDNIFYDFNRATLRPKSMKTLDKLAKFLTDNDVKVELSAHTDTRGRDAYNQKLSQLRAQKCVDYLIKEKGINPKHIIAKGYGEEKHAQVEYNGKMVTLDDEFVYGFKDKETQEEYHQLNRRTEVTILEYNKKP